MFILQSNGVPFLFYDQTTFCLFFPRIIRFPSCQTYRLERNYHFHLIKNMMDLRTTLLQTCMLILAVSEVILAERRRVSFLNCPSKVTNTDVVIIKPARSRIDCSVICPNDPDCLSASYCLTTDGQKCTLSGVNTQGSCAGLVADGDCSQTAMVSSPHCLFTKLHMSDLR